jgi:hypothetical protein
MAGASRWLDAPAGVENMRNAANNVAAASSKVMMIPALDQSCWRKVVFMFPPDVVRLNLSR